MNSRYLAVDRSVAQTAAPGTSGPLGRGWAVLGVPGFGDGGGVWGAIRLGQSCLGRAVGV